VPSSDHSYRAVHQRELDAFKMFRGDADRRVGASRVLKKAQSAQYHADKLSAPGKELCEFVEASIWLRVPRRSE
jgi:hypothetical protein